MLNRGKFDYFLVARVSSGPPYLCDASGFAGAPSAVCYRLVLVP